jgi:hypothetical protein
VTNPSWVKTREEQQSIIASGGSGPSGSDLKGQTERESESTVSPKTNKGII